MTAQTEERTGYSPSRLDIQSLIDSGTPTGTSSEQLAQYGQAFWDLAEQTIRSARRVSEVMVLHAAKQEIVNEVTQQVRREIQQQFQQLRSEVFTGPEPGGKQSRS
jgi:hypothetical protein